MGIIFEEKWFGKTVGVNRRKDARAIKKNGKWIAMMYESTEYKKFKESLIAAFLSFDPPYTGPVDLAISCSLHKRKDTDSFIKPLMDSLEKSNIIKNDNLIRNIHVFRSYHHHKELDLIKVRLISVNSETPDKEWPCEMPNNMLPAEVQEQLVLFSKD